MASGLVRCGHCGQANRVPAAAAGTPRCGKCHQPLPWIADADDTTFGEVAEAARIPVLVDLWAPWCGPCRMVSPALEQLARDLAGKVKLIKVNVDTSPQISQRFGAQAIPALRPGIECQGRLRRLRRRVHVRASTRTTLSEARTTIVASTAGTQRTW